MILFKAQLKELLIDSKLILPLIVKKSAKREVSLILKNNCLYVTCQVNGNNASDEDLFWFWVSLKIILNTPAYIHHFECNEKKYEKSNNKYIFIGKAETFNQSHLEKLKIIYPIIIDEISQHNKKMQTSRIAYSLGLFQRAIFDYSGNLQFLLRFMALEALLGGYEKEIGKTIKSISDRFQEEYLKKNGCSVIDIKPLWGIRSEISHGVNIDKQKINFKQNLENLDKLLRGTLFQILSDRNLMDSFRTYANFKNWCQTQRISIK